MRQYLQCGRFGFNLDKKAVVMGILNVTPDSFSDGGRHASLEFAVTHAEQMIEQGVDMIDIGGESSRPGAPVVPLEDELRRVMPVIYALRELDKPLSIDTWKPEVMREAVLAGADMINDINGFRASGAIEAVRDADCGLCLMHMLRDPATMQQDPHYDDVVGEVIAFLRSRVDAMTAAGIDRERICIDPGFGFGKTLEHNLALLRALERFADLGAGAYVGLSRKSMIGALTGRPAGAARASGSATAALIAVQRGARMVRVHDVAATVDALAIWRAVHEGDASPRRDARPPAPRWPDED